MKSKLKYFFNLENCLFCICALSVIIISLTCLNSLYPFSGSDFRQHLSWLLSNHILILKNGIHTIYWTPSFGGGVPVFPNPQSMQFSLPQCLIFFFNPWVSINFTLAIFLAIGAVYIFRFFLLITEKRITAIVGAVFFMCTGFYINHICAGHLDFHSYPLIAALYFYIFAIHRPLLSRSIKFSIILSYMVYTGGFFCVLMFFFSMLICIPLLIYLYKDFFKRKLQIFKLVISGILLSFLLCSAKLVAVWHFMRFFPRIIGYTTQVPFSQACVSVLAQLFYVPFYLLFVSDKGCVSRLRFITGTHFGLWELDIGMPLLLSLFIGLSLLIRPLILINFLKKKKNRVVWLVLCITAVICVLEFTIVKGSFYRILKKMPVLKSIHVNVRFAGCFIIPLIVIFVFGFERLKMNQRLFNFLCVIIIVFTIYNYSFYVKIPEFIHSAFDIRKSIILWDKIRENIRDFKVKYVKDISDMEALFQNATSRYPYFPVFGYKLSKFKPEIKLGKVDEIVGNGFNMTNPVSLVYPFANNLKLFSKISKYDFENFSLFINYKIPKWHISKLQVVANYITIISFSIFLIYFLLPYLTVARTGHYLRKRASKCN